jgi:hypothetical protein
MDMFPVLLSGILARDEMARDRVVTALRVAGALSPASARPFEDLHVQPDETWNRLVSEGRIREGPPSHFYLYDAQQKHQRQRRLKMVVFYLLMILIPVVLFLFT